MSKKTSKTEALSLNPNELKDFLKHIITNNRFLQENDKSPVSTEVVGESGIGKTSSIIQLADELNLNFVKLNLAQIEEIGDLVGFPIRQFEMELDGAKLWIDEHAFDEYRKLGYKSTSKNRMSYCPPEWIAGKENGDIPDHSTWEEFEDMSEAEKKLMEKQLEHMLKEVAQQVKGRGTVPGEMQGLLDKINSKEPPKFDWRGYLRRFAGGSQKVYTKKLRRKFNKRFEEMAGLKVKPRKHILVAIDTSGSVSDDELREFFHEIDHINKTGAEITVLQCDTKINSVKKYSAGDTVEIFGRGGTEFDPVIEYYNQHLKNFSCMVYLTDGECYCTVKPRGKMLWVISSRSQMNESLPGPKIKLN